MEMSKYIRRVDVKGLWGTCDLSWDLTSDVNVLSGSNGSGKSTVLGCLSDLFTDGTISTALRSRVGSMIVEFTDGTVVDSDHPFDPTAYNVAVISTFDTSLQSSEAIFKLSDGTVATYLDWELYRLQNRYLSYQLEVGRSVISALQSGVDPVEITALTARRIEYFDIIDTLLEPMGKRVDRDSDRIQFLTRNGTVIRPYQLSSGEKQILIILTTVLIEGGRDFIMIMDEPEISLHFEWQRRLIEDIQRLNPNLQLILATHSPAVVMNGWTDCVSEISELVQAHND